MQIVLRKVNFKDTLNNPNIWRDVVGYEGLYKISYNGMVYSYISDKILKPAVSGGNYLSVVLWKSSHEKRTHTIHRMIAEAFIPNPERKKCVNHVLGNKLNNHVAWLEWATHKDNNTHAIRFGLRKVRATPEVIASIVSEHIKGDKHRGAEGLAAKYGFNKSTIHDILNQYKYNNNGI